jgi:hypothetical protein
MAITHVASVRNNLADRIDELVNTGAGTAKLQIETTGGGTVLATINLQNPAFGAAAAGIITLQGTPLSDTDADATGTAAEFAVTDRDGADVFRGSVGTSGEDINLSQTDVEAGDTVTITSFTYEAPN